MTHAQAPDLLQRILGDAERAPGRPAILDARGRVTTYGDLRSMALAVADDLVRHGVSVGDGVLLALRPSPKAVAAALGVVAAGGVVVIADPGAGSALSEVRRNVVPVKAAMADAVVHAATGTRSGRWLAARLIRGSAHGLTLPDLTSTGLHHVVDGPWLPGVPNGATRWSALASHDHSEFAVNPTQSESQRDCVIVFTSGSTSEPKAVVHSRASLSAGIDAAVSSLALDEAVVMHTDQLMVGLPVLAAGGRWSLPSVFSSPKRWLEQAARAGATHAYAIPAKLLEVAALGLPDSVTWLGMGGAPVLPQTVLRLKTLMPGARITAIYGMTEALPVAIADDADVLASPPDRTSLGRPVSGTSVTIDAPDREGVGEIIVAGPQVRPRYAGKATSGRVATGDLGELRPDGTLLLAGRAKNMIIRGQANIYPELVEPLLLEALREDVVDLAVIGVPDRISGDEAVVLALAPRSGHVPQRAAVERELLAGWQRFADAAWRPDRIEWVEAIPRRGRSGAADLRRLRDLVSR